MVSGSLYERYKDALRRGHVAGLRGRLDAALDAYGEAASIARDRALPHGAMGGILLKMGRPADALTAFDRALALASDDETALRGRAEVLTAAGRRIDAAVTLDRLADKLDAAGRLADACDAARRALELAESKPRRKQVENLAARLRASAGDEAAERALAQALRFLEPQPEPEPIDGLVAGAAAEAALYRGEADVARQGLLIAAVAHRQAGRSVAAIDACYLALAVGPDDVDLHLLLAELYLERGWRAPAVEKLLLLGRLADLTDNREARDRLCRIASEWVADEPRLAELCA